ncbi:ABC transporter B family member 1 [Vitis vinifera]|uniref:ABC transporter B family member 1 n=1 Tax=Vitis vinifera TaxID=29760 RepID=A0A438DKC5_VITVI|nr:ABC transporter B family member 1 [Vitis vinifera]
MDGTEPKNQPQPQPQPQAQAQAHASGSGEKTELVPSSGFGELFRFADGLDYVLMTIGSIGAIVHGSSLPIFLRFFADLVNSFGSNANNIDKMMQEVLKYAFYFLVVGAAIWASSWAEISCWMWTGERQSTKMRIKYLEAALNQDIQFFDTEVRTSDVVFAVNTDAVMVQDAISEKLGNFIHYMATFVSGFVVGFTAVWQLALVTLAVVPLIAVIGGIHTATLAKLSAKSQEALSEAGNIAEQTIVQIRVVFAFVGESRALQAYSAALRISQRLGYKSGFSKGMGLGATYFTVFCCYALLLWYGGYLVRHHYTNGGLAIATMFSVMLGGLALGQSAPSMSAFAKAKVAAAKIFRIIDHKPNIERNGETGLELESVTGQVELKNVDFSYPSRPEVRILSDFSLNVPAGKTIALVGSSGSGKSTVVSLIERFYDPTSVGEFNVYLLMEEVHVGHVGQVLLDGHDIKTLKLRWLRQQIGLVSQEPALFATTIKENMLLGRPDATLVEIEEAARVANAYSFIVKLPEGFDTQLWADWVTVEGEVRHESCTEGLLVLEIHLSLDASHPNYRLEKLAFKEQASSFWRLAKMNSPEWVYALFGTIGSVVCGSISAFFAYVLSAVLSVYYNQNHAYMSKQIGNGRKSTKRVREKMLAAVLKNEMAWFDQEENESARIAARLALDANNVSHCFAGEAIANVRTVAAFNSEAKIVGLFSTNLQTPLRRCFWKGQIAGSGYGIAQFLLYASYALGLWYASWLVKHGISDFSKTIRVFMVLMMPFQLLDRLRGEVELKHVDFSYPSRPDVPVFRDLCLRARAGKTLALVGPSGCGKSSVIALVQRFYEPTSGRVMIDGKDIRKYNLKSLRRHIAIVPRSHASLLQPFMKHCLWTRVSN